MELEIRVNKLNGEGKVKALASITFDKVFTVHSIKIIEGSKGLFVSMPSRKNEKDEYVDIAHPVTDEFRKELSSKILEKYSNLSKEA